MGCRLSLFTISACLAVSLMACGEDEPTTNEETTQAEAVDNAPAAQPAATPAPATPEASPSAATPAPAAAPAASAAPSATAAPRSPEEAALQARCDRAFDNLLRIMTEDGAPASILDKMKGQRDSQRRECMKTSVSDPSSAVMLECMGSAKGQPELRACMDSHMKGLKAKAEAAGASPTQAPPAPAAAPAAPSAAPAAPSAAPASE